MRTLSETRRRIINIILYFTICTVAVILDRISKDAATHLLKGKDSYPLLKNVFHLTYCENKGAAFSILSGQRWIFIVTTTIAIIAMFISVFLFKKANCLFYLSLGMVAGGGIGNMIDRIGIGYVVDFFDFTLINFAIFNVADIFICVGVALFALDVIFFEKEDNFKLSNLFSNKG